ncbi:MAG: 4-hydroxy-tetrahydrodipicolinate synthase [Bacteroidales bacterium]|nr:4-hydroxy-tetrahydrodipicolinate synthase [Bacteroidales bacterium]
MKNKLSGTGVALVTPFNNDFSVDYQSLRNIVNYVIDNGVDFLVALGTTGEPATLNAKEKELVVKTIVETAQKRVPVVVGIGGNDTLSVVEQIKNYSFTGIDAILSVVPYYTKPQQDGLFAHFDAVASASPVPIILYNVPGRTSVNMLADTTLKLAERHQNIVAVKEASGDFAQIMKIIQYKPAHFEVLSGDDAITLPLIACGATGVISVVANALAGDFSKMVKSAMNNQFVEAKVLHYKLLEMTGLFFANGSPSGVKSLMAEMGLCSEIVRLPLVPVNAMIKNQIIDEWNRIK